MTALRIPATFMRGGTSKGVFFLARDLPEDAAERDALLLRVVGSPDGYGKQIDGMGGGTSSTSKVVIVSPSSQPGCAIEYRFGAVSIERPVIDWSGNCGNLSAAVAPFAIHAGLVEAPATGTASVAMWQAAIGKQVIAHVPMRDGAVEEAGDFMLDGVAFPAAAIDLEFIDPGGHGGTFPSGRMTDTLDVPEVGPVDVTLLNSGIAMIFVEAGSLGLAGIEMPPQVNADAALLARAERIRCHGAVAMGLAADADAAHRLRPHSPKLAFVAAPRTFTASDGKSITDDSINLVARTFSMGALHHAMTGTGAVALATAAAIPGTLVHRVARSTPKGPLRIGHPSGRLEIQAAATQIGGEWHVDHVTVTRSARRLMEGHVIVPEPRR